MIRATFLGIVSIFTSLVTSSAWANSQTYQKTVDGHVLTLTVDAQAGSAKVEADGRLLGTVELGNPPDFLGPFEFDQTPVEILQIESGGTACEALYFAVVFSPAPTLSKAFGNCSDQKSVVSTANSVTLTLPAPDGGTDSYTIDDAGLHTVSTAPTPTGPPPTGDDDLASSVLAEGYGNLFAIRAPSAAIQKLVGPAMFNDLKTCSINQSPAAIPPYVVVASELSSSCRYPGVYFVFDRHGGVWVGTQPTPDADTTWYGSPPASVIKAANTYDKLINH